MADAQVLYAEDLAATTANSTAWVDLATIAAGSFTANKRYLILANQVVTNNSSANYARIRIVHGTTPTVFTDAALSQEMTATTQEHEESYLIDFTQPGTTELVKLQISSSSTNVTTNRLSQIIAVNLDDVGASGTDYFWGEDLGDYTLTTTPTAKAITASFTPNGADRWLFIGHMVNSTVTITDNIGFELFDSVAGVLNQTWQEAEDTADIHAHVQYWVGVPTNAARTLAVRPWNEGGSNVMLSSRVLALNLAKFAQSASAFDASEIDPATSPSYSTVATVAPTPSATGNWVIIAFSNQDINEQTTDWRARLQVNPDGSGLVSDPAFSSTAPQIDNWDAIDEIAFSVFNLAPLTSGAARTINWDWAQVTGTTGRVEDNGLVAFSVALASAGTEAPAGLASGTGAAANASTQIVTFPGAASGAGAAGAATGNVGAAPSAATGSGTAYDAAAGIGVAPSAATGTGAAGDASAQIAVFPGVSAGTGAAYDPTVQTFLVTEAPAGLASGTGAALGPAVFIQPTADLAAGTGAAGAVTTELGAIAGLAAGTGTASDAAVALGIFPTAASGSGAAYQPTVETFVSTSAPAGLASATGVAYDPAIQVWVNALAGHAAGTGAAYDATVTATATVAGLVGRRPLPRILRPRILLPPRPPLPLPEHRQAPAGAAVAAGQAFDAMVAVLDHFDDEVAMLLLLGD